MLGSVVGGGVVVVLVEVDVLPVVVELDWVVVSDVVVSVVVLVVVPIRRYKLTVV